MMKNKSKSSAKRPRTNLQKMQELYDRLNARGADVGTLDEGTTTLRFLPSPNDPDGLFYTFRKRHWLPVPGREKAIPLTCPKTEDEAAECPACAAQAHFARSGTKEDKTLARNLSARNEFLSNVLILDKKTKKWAQSVKSYPWTVWKSLFSQESSAVEDGEIEVDEDGLISEDPVADPEKGIVFKITRTGKSMDTEYEVTPSLHVTRAVTEEELEACVDLREELEPSDVAQLAEAVCTYLNIDDLSEIDVKCSVVPEKSSDEEEEEGDEEETDEEEETTQEDTPPVPDCFSKYDAKRTKRRGCAECHYLKACKSVSAA